MQLKDQRASDSDRADVNGRLQIAVEEGRLDIHEYDERLQKAMAAKTFGQLDKLIADLPTTQPARRAQVANTEPEAPQAAAAHRCAQTRHRNGQGAAYGDRTKARWGGFCSAAVFFTGIWAFTWIVQGGAAPPYYWPIWILGFWGIGLIMSTMRHWK